MTTYFRIYLVYILFCTSLCASISGSNVLDTELINENSINKLNKIENRFWNSIKHEKSFGKEVAKAVRKIRDPNINISASEEINLTNHRKWEIVQHLDTVQQKKLNARLNNHPNKPYLTSYNRNGNGDPSPEKIFFRETKMTISLNYNGSPSTKQPGNNYFIEDQKKAITFNLINGIDLETPAVQILLLNEISRRHAYDPSRANSKELNEGYDEFKDLPIGLCLAMASQAIRENKLQLKDFWLKTGDYHPYTGDLLKRKQACLKIYDVYKRNFLNNLNEIEERFALENLMYTYFEYPHDELSKNLCKMFDDIDIEI